MTDLRLVALIHAATGSEDTVRGALAMHPPAPVPSSS